MKIPALNLLIVDNNKLIIDTLSKHLVTRFGMGVNISPFFDAESCQVKIDEQSHVIVLDYFLNHEEKENKRGLNIFNSIKEKNPTTQVTMISSSEAPLKAMEDMQRETSNYIIKQERSLQKIFRTINRIVISPVYKIVVSPIHVRIILPIRKIISEYTLKDYLVMFIVAFISVGTLVFFGLKIFR